MRSCFLVHESLRRAYNLICKHAAAWARSTLVFEGWRHEGIRSFYTALGVDDSWIGVYTDLQIRFVGGRLLVAEPYTHRGNVIGLDAATLLKTWGFRRFAEGRFVPIGKASRSRVLSIALGLQRLIDFIVLQGESVYYLGGFIRNCAPRSDTYHAYSRCRLVLAMPFSCSSCDTIVCLYSWPRSTRPCRCSWAASRSSR